MLTIVYCTRETKPSHEAHLIKTSGIHKDIQVIEVINNGISLTKAYNDALAEAKYDHVVFCHDDITLETKQWGVKLLKHFTGNPEYAVIGVAGSKSMPESGRWWENRTTMYGWVKHTHEGRTWLNKYNEDQDKRIEEVVNVDGLFFAIDKTKVHRLEDGSVFNEAVEGFHFYDVEFSFRNHINGPKVGVVTTIRVNHQSIGATNEQWEQNRLQFIEQYKDSLPIKVKESFEHRKLKVLIGCLNFQGLTGSEISTLETAKGLSKAGCDVHVISSTVSDKFNLICKRHGIKTYLMNNPPGFMLGDGKWSIQRVDGTSVPSQPNVLYQTGDVHFDVIHANHTPITTQLLNLYPNAKFLNVVRSEVIDLENPVVDERIKKYLAVRPTIKDHMVENFDIDPEMIEVVYNPFDKSRFKPNSLPSGVNKPVTLFVGTMDYLRKEPIEDLITTCEQEGKELWLVGKDSGNYAEALGQEYDHVKYFPPTDNIEEFFYKCDETAGIFLGRTTIEGYLCGKPAIIYRVDKQGKILGKEFTDVPEDLTIFDIDTIIKKIKNLYIEVANS